MGIAGTWRRAGISSVGKAVAQSNVCGMPHPPRASRLEGHQPCVLPYLSSQLQQRVTHLTYLTSSPCRLCLLDSRCGRSDCSQPVPIHPHRPQLSPGVYDEDAMVAIDWVLHRAEVHGVRVLVSMIDNWRYFNGIDQVGGPGPAGALLCPEPCVASGRLPVPLTMLDAIMPYGILQ